MAYQPTLADVPQVSAGGYQPSLADIPNNDKLPMNNWQPNFQAKIAPNIVAGLAQLGHNILNAPHNLVNAVSPSLASHIPAQQSYDFAQMLKLPNTTSDKIVQGLAANAPALAMPELPLGAAGNAVRAIPGIGKFTANAMSRVAPQAALGAATNQNPLQGAEQYGGIQAGLEGLSVPFKGIKAGLGYLKPDQFAQGILDKIGGGLNLADNSRELAKKVQLSYNKAKQSGQDLYNDIFNRASNIPSGIINTTLKSGAYSQLPSKIIDKYNFDLEDLHKDFNDNPSIQTAHPLQSQLGFEQRALEKSDRKSTLSPADKNTLIAVTRARSALLGDIHNSLETAQKGLGDEYQGAAENWMNNVIPYEQNAKLSPIVKTKPEKLTNKMVQSLGNEFKNPDEDMTKIASDIGPSISNHILFDRLGKLSGKVTADNLTSEVNKLKNEGFSNYISPEFSSMLSQLNRRSKARLGAESLPGLISGGYLGSHFGPLGEIAGASIAAPISIAGSHIVNSLLPKKGLPDSVKNAILNTYQPLGRAIGQNALSNQ